MEESDGSLTPAPTNHSDILPRAPLAVEGREGDSDHSVFPTPCRQSTALCERRDINKCIPHLHPGFTQDGSLSFALIALTLHHNPKKNTSTRD